MDLDDGKQCRDDLSPLTARYRNILDDPEAFDRAIARPIDRFLHDRLGLVRRLTPTKRTGDEHRVSLALDKAAAGPPFIVSANTPEAWVSALSLLTRRP